MLEAEDLVRLRLGRGEHEDGTGKSAANGPTDLDGAPTGTENVEDHEPRTELIDLCHGSIPARAPDPTKRSCAGIFTQEVGQLRVVLHHEHVDFTHGSRSLSKNETTIRLYPRSPSALFRDCF